jgi:hypothetical protein
MEKAFRIMAHRRERQAARPLWYVPLQEDFDTVLQANRLIRGHIERALVVTSAANLFINREQETQQRAATIRRISLCLFVCEKNHYVIQLPSIQARLVDLSRGFASNPVVMSEVSQQEHPRIALSPVLGDVNANDDRSRFVSRLFASKALLPCGSS